MAVLRRDEGWRILLQLRQLYWRLGCGQWVEEQVMEERERDEGVETIGDELLLGERELGDLEMVVL